MAWDPPLAGRAADFLVEEDEWNKIGTSFGVLPRVLAGSGTAVDVVNTAAETSVFSHSIAANLLGTNGAVNLIVGGDYLNDSGAGRTFTLRIKLGATTIFADDSPSIGAGAARGVWTLDVILGNLNATNAQHLNGEFLLSDRTAPTTGLGNLANVGGLISAAIGSAPTNPTVDTTSAQTLDVTVQHSTNNANLSFRKKYATLIYLPVP